MTSRDHLLRVLTVIGVGCGSMLGTAYAGTISLPIDQSFNNGFVPVFRIVTTSGTTSGYAISGVSSVSGSSGVYGGSTDGAGLVGSSGSGTGLAASSTSGYGINASSATNNGIVGSGYNGVVGNGTAVGVYGSTSGSTNQAGVFGTAGLNAAGILGQQTSNGVGVWGKNTGTGNGGTGVYGSSVGNTGDVGVVGDCPSPGYAGYFYGNVYATGSITAFSDVRAKKDIRDLPYGLAQAMNLRPVTFRWKQSTDAGVQIGFIAQEVQKVIPEVVATNREGMLSLNYIALLPVAMKAIQEQQKVIEKQEVRIASLERGRAPLASMFSGNLAEGVALGLLPVGFIAILRRGRRRVRE